MSSTVYISIYLISNPSHCIPLPPHSAATLLSLCLGGSVFRVSQASSLRYNISDRAPHILLFAPSKRQMSQERAISAVIGRIDYFLLQVSDPKTSYAGCCRSRTWAPKPLVAGLGYSRANLPACALCTLGTRDSRGSARPFDAESQTKTNYAERCVVRAMHFPTAAKTVLVCNVI